MKKKKISSKEVVVFITLLTEVIKLIGAFIN